MRRNPRRSSRRHVDYSEVNEDDDPGFLFDMEEDDYVMCVQSQPKKTYEIRLGGAEVEVWCEDEFKRRLYPKWLEYVNLRVGKKLSMKDVYRFYLNMDEGDEVEMNIDYVVFPSISDVKVRGMAEGVYHGGEVKSGTNEVVEWFPIQIHSISMVNLVAVVEDLRAQGMPISEEEKQALYAFNITENTHDDQARFQVTLKTPWKITDLIDRYCREKPGRRIRVSGPGFRTVGKESSHLQIRSARLFMGGMEGLCIYSAILNAISLSCGEEYATMVMNGNQIVTARDLKGLSRSVQVWASHVSLNIPDSCTATTTELDMGWIDDKQEGVFIANIIGTNGVDHLICLDFDRKWIVEGAEHHPLHMCSESVNACCGNGNQFLKFQNIRQVVGIGNFKRTKKARNRSRKSKKRAKARKGALLQKSANPEVYIES